MKPIPLSDPDPARWEQHRGHSPSHRRPFQGCGVAKGDGCLICVSREPHEHFLGAILNSRHYCPDRGEHVWTKRRRFLREHDRCTRCGEWGAR